MATEFATQYHLLPLIDGRRYPHELQDPTRIPSEIRTAVLELLRKYYVAVVVSAPTLSEASGTSVAAYSEASAATSITEMTSAFSANNGPVQREPVKKPLDNVQRARKALLRKLRACAKDCRRRKVKCPLWHHALRDLLENEHTEHDEEVVEWAIRYDAELQTPVAVTSASARVTRFASGSDVEERNNVVDHTNGVFDLDPGTPMPYGSGIVETTASLINESVGASPGSFTNQENVLPDSPPPSLYSIYKDDFMLPLGSRVTAVEPARYRCWFGDCTLTLPLPGLISHFQWHLPFQRLDDPLRMVCPHCDTFYSCSTDRCFECDVEPQALVERVFGCFPNETIVNMQSDGGAVQSGPTFFGSSVAQGISEFSYHGSGSTPWNTGYNQNNYHYGSSGGYGAGYYSFTKSVLGCLKQRFFSAITASLRYCSAIIRRRKLVATLVVAIVVSIIFGYKKHGWLLSKLVHLTHGVSMLSPSKLPLIGVVITSVAFALHRLVAHTTRANNIQSGWLSRCAFNAFNVACGRRRPEWPATANYGLGHSRS